MQTLSAAWLAASLLLLFFFFVVQELGTEVKPIPAVIDKQLYCA